MKKEKEESVDSPTSEYIDCKTAAEKYDCSIHTVKNWARKKEVESQQQGERQPYFINADALEQKLKSSPTVKSIFQTALDDAVAAPKPISEKAISTSEPQEQREKMRDESAPFQSESHHRRKSAQDSPRRASRSQPRSQDKTRRKSDLRQVIQLAKRLPLADKVRLKNEMSRLIDAA